MMATGLPPERQIFHHRPEGQGCRPQGLWLTNLRVNLPPLSSLRGEAPSTGQPASRGDSGLAIGGAPSKTPEAQFTRQQAPQSPSQPWSLQQESSWRSPGNEGPGSGCVRKWPTPTVSEQQTMMAEHLASLWPRLPAMGTLDTASRVGRRVENQLKVYLFIIARQGESDRGP